MTNVVCEIVVMKGVENVTKERFIEIADYIERNFHSKQSGFIDTELLYDEKENAWIMIQHWKTIEEMKAASKKMFFDTVTEEFRSVLDPKQVKMTVYPSLGTWQSDL